MSTESVFVEAAKARIASGDTGGARAFLEEILRLSPQHRWACLTLARVLLGSNPAAAAEVASRVTSDSASDGEAWGLLGQAQSLAGRSRDAVEAFRQAAKLAPRDGAAESNLSIALLRSGDTQGALEAGQRAVTLAPGLPETHACLGHALSYLKRSEDALNCFRSALELRGDNPDALVGIARVYRNQGLFSTAILALLRAVEIAPDWQPGLIELASLYRESGEFALAAETNEKVLSQSAGFSYFESNRLFDMQYDPAVDEETAVAEARAWGLRQIAAIGRQFKVPRARQRSSGGALHIGYVTADFYRHPVGWLGGDAIALHDKSAVRVSVYANQTIEDDVTLKIKAAADGWVPISGLDDASVAERIARDGIDVLVDLSGHTAGHRLAAFARRPAPLQISWLGYFATTGLPAMDYVLADGDFLGEEGEGFYCERILRLPRLRHGYAPPGYAPGVREPPMLASGAPTFGSFNNASKLNPVVLDVWARILAAVPDSRLILKWRSFNDPWIQERVRARFAGNGIDGDRILFDGASPHSAMLAQYGEIDVALDPFPFSGALTTCEALWMGVPVVTMPGRRPVSRQSHAILRSIGLSEWSAASADEYVAIAAGLVEDVTALRSMRSRMRDRIKESVLLDARGLAALLEQTYHHAYKVRA